MKQDTVSNIPSYGYKVSDTLKRVCVASTIPVTFHFSLKCLSSPNVYDICRIYTQLIKALIVKIYIYEKLGIFDRFRGQVSGPWKRSKIPSFYTYKEEGKYLE